jgi:hypothetical protein
MNAGSFSRDDMIGGGLALLLAISLLFFPFHHYSAGPFSADFSATGSPDSVWGVLALICVIAFIADLALERLSPQTQIPAIGGSRGMTRLVLAGAALALIVLKFIFHTSNLGWGFFITLIVAIALVVGAVRVNQGQAIIPSGPAGPAGPAA